MVDYAERNYFEQTQRTFQRVEEDSDVLNVDFYGGLNTENSPVSFPFSDSPSLMNLTVTKGGSLTKRAGSIRRLRQSSAASGSFLTLFKIRTGERLLIGKRQQNILVWLLPEKGDNSLMQQVEQYTHVWNSSARNKRPDYVWFKGVESSRLIMVMEEHVPIELEVMEIKMTGDGDTDVAFTGDYTSNYGSDNAYCIYGETINACTNVAHAGGTTTFTFTDNIPSGQEFTFVQLHWHWWTESIKRTNEQCVASEMKIWTNDVSADSLQTIPSEIRRGVVSDFLSAQSFYSTDWPTNTYGNIPITLTDNLLTVYNQWTFNIAPNGGTLYAFTDGTIANAAGDRPSVGFTYRFNSCAVAVSNDATQFIRWHYLPFLGHTEVAGNALDVRNSADIVGTQQVTAGGITRTANTTSTFYWSLMDNAATSTHLTTVDAATAGHFWSLEGGSPVGCGSDFVEVNHITRPTDYSGNATSTSYYDPKVDGTFRPWYGASYLCNYRTGVFPTTVDIYQGRLVLGGISSSPLSVWMSNVLDNGSKYDFQNFQSHYEDSTVSYNPLEIVLDGISGEEIIGMETWFNSLFIFTNESVYRVHGGSNVAVTPTNVYQAKVGSVGGINPYCSVVTDSNVFFHAANGFYRVALQQNGEEYKVENVALKVTDLFEKSGNTVGAQWCAYSPKYKRIWVALCEEGYRTPTRMLVYDVARESWMEYGLTNGYFFSSGGCASSDRVLVETPQYPEKTGESYVSANHLILEFERDDLQTDATYYPTFAELAAGENSYMLKNCLSLTIENDQAIYRTLPDHIPDAQREYGFRMTPVDELTGNYEISYYQVVGAEWTTLTHGSDYVTLPRQSAVMGTRLPWNDGDTLRIYLMNDDGNHPIHVYCDEVELVQDTDYTVSVASDWYVPTLEAGHIADHSADNVYRCGMSIRCWYLTPTFLRKSPQNLKRTTHYVGYFSNDFLDDLFDQNDVNTTVSQDPEEICDRFKKDTNLNVAVLFNNRSTGEIFTELYQNEELFADLSLFDISPAQMLHQLNDPVRFVIPVIGSGYSFQVAAYNYGTGGFKLVGYQVTTKAKGRSSKPWF